MMIISLDKFILLGLKYIHRVVGIVLHSAFGTHIRNVTPHRAQADIAHHDAAGAPPASGVMPAASASSPPASGEIMKDRADGGCVLEANRHDGHKKIRRRTSVWVILLCSMNDLVLRCQLFDAQDPTVFCRAGPMYNKIGNGDRGADGGYGPSRTATRPGDDDRGAEPSRPANRPGDDATSTAGPNTSGGNGGEGTKPAKRPADDATPPAPSASSGDPSNSAESAKRPRTVANIGSYNTYSVRAMKSTTDWGVDNQPPSCSDESTWSWDSCGWSWDSWGYGETWSWEDRQGDGHGDRDRQAAAVVPPRPVSDVIVIDEEPPPPLPPPRCPPPPDVPEPEQEPCESRKRKMAVYWEDDGQILDIGDGATSAAGSSGDVPGGGSEHVHHDDHGDGGSEHDDAGDQWYKKHPQYLKPGRIEMNRRG